MGNFLQKYPMSPYDRNLLQQLKTRKMTDVLDCVKAISVDYADVQCIDYTQFDDIFGCLVDDSEPFFTELQNDHDIEGKVDVYESLAAFSIFCGDKFETKADFIFKLFDFDRSGTLENAELVLTLQSAVRGLCKLVHIEPPSLKLLEEVSDSIFVLIDHDNNKKISFQEFFFWISNNTELQDFLLKYANTQTKENLERRYKFLVMVFSQLYNSAAGSVEYDVCESSDLRKLVETEAKEKLKKEDINFLMDILRATTISMNSDLASKEGTISRKAYAEVIKAWCAFSAADIGNDNSLNALELRSLLWVYEGQEPSDIRVKNDLADIDSDKTGFIDRFEWIKHFCSTDKSGKMVFRSNLKELFEKYDKDNSGYLTIDEVRMIMKEAFKSYANKAKDSEMKDRLNEMIDTLSEEVFKELDSSGDKSLNWEEFKHFMEIAMGRQDKLKKFLDMNF